MVTEAQARAKKKWNEKNKEKNRIYRYKSYARKYINDIATQDDLEELQQIIQKRLSNN